MWLRNKSGPKAPSVRGVTDGFEKGIFRPSDPKFVRGINTVRNMSTQRVCQSNLEEIINLLYSYS